MAVYDLEEQDQLEDLKTWWKQWGTTVLGVALAVCLGVLGVQGWRWWQGNQAVQASVLYNAVSSAARSNDVAKAKDAVAQLTDRYASTGYAPRAALLAAKLLFDSGDRAGAMVQLHFVIDRASEDELKQIARIRLAEVQFDDKQYDEALRTLDAKHDEPFAGVYADLRGDILAAAGRAGEARLAYQTAMTRIDAASPYRSFVQAKLDAVGGPPSGTDGAARPAGAALPASASAKSAPKPSQ
jgi:predicted negative regulator of RcsB-dependent stress response